MVSAMTTTPLQRVLRSADNQKAYKSGYQHALADILTALEDGGEEAVREWISQNCEDQP